MAGWKEPGFDLEIGTQYGGSHPMYVNVEALLLGKNRYIQCGPAFQAAQPACPRFLSGPKLASFRWEKTLSSGNDWMSPWFTGHMRLSDYWKTYRAGFDFAKRQLAEELVANRSEKLQIAGDVERLKKELNTVRGKLGDRQEEVKMVTNQLDLVKKEVKVVTAQLGEVKTQVHREQQLLAKVREDSEKMVAAKSLGDSVVDVKEMVAELQLAIAKHANSSGKVARMKRQMAAILLQARSRKESPRLAAGKFTAETEWDAAGSNIERRGAGEKVIELQKEVDAMKSVVQRLEEDRQRAQLQEAQAAARKVLQAEAESARQDMQELQGGETVQELQGGKTVQELQGGKTVQGLQRGETVQVVQGDKTVHELQGGKKMQELQGVETAQALQGVEMAQALQGVETAQELQGAETVQELQGVETVHELQGVQTVHELQGGKTVQELQGGETVPELQGDETVPKLQGVETVQELQGDKTVQNLNELQKGETVRELQGDEMVQPHREIEVLCVERMVIRDNLIEFRKEMDAMKSAIGRLEGEWKAEMLVNKGGKLPDAEENLVKQLDVELETVRAWHEDLAVIVEKGGHLPEAGNESIRQLEGAIKGLVDESAKLTIEMQKVERETQSLRVMELEKERESLRAQLQQATVVAIVLHGQMMVLEEAWKTELNAARSELKDAEGKMEAALDGERYWVKVVERQLDTLKAELYLTEAAKKIIRPCTGDQAIMDSGTHAAVMDAMHD